MCVYTIFQIKAENVYLAEFCYTGTVEAFQELDCEVVFHPSYMAPEDGEFALQVHGGNSMSLKCNAKVFDELRLEKLIFMYSHLLTYIENYFTVREKINMVLLLYINKFL